MANPTQICVFNETSKLIDITPGVSAFQGVTAAGSPVVLNANGVIDSTLIGQGTNATAGETLQVGNLVNLYDDAGTLKMQLAYADATGTAPSGGAYPVLAHGYVADNIGSGNTGTISFSGVFVYTDTHSEFSSADLGVEVYLSQIDKGGITKTRPSGPGQADQSVGYVLAYDSATHKVSVLFLAGFKDFSQISGIAQINQGGTGASTANGAIHNIFGTQTVNKVFAGPSSGPAADPAFRTLVNSDLSGAASGLDTYVQINNAGAISSDQQFVWNHTAHALGIGPQTAAGQLDGIVVAGVTAVNAPAAPAGTSLVDVAASTTNVSTFSAPAATLAIGTELTPSANASSGAYYGVFNEILVPGTAAQPIGAIYGTQSEIDYWGTGAVTVINGNNTAVNLQSNAAVSSVTAVQGNLSVNGNSPISISASGGYFNAFTYGTGAIAELDGLSAQSGPGAGSSAITANNAVFAQSGCYGGTATVTDDRTLYVKSPSVLGGTMTHHYGLYMEDQTVGGGSNPDPWSIYAVAGKAFFGSPIVLGISSGSQIVAGTGTPEGNVTASVGSIFLRRDGGAGTSFYVKESGAGNTGWTAGGGGGSGVSLTPTSSQHILNQYALSMDSGSLRVGSVSSSPAWLQIFNEDLWFETTSVGTATENVTVQFISVGAADAAAFALAGDAVTVDIRTATNAITNTAMAAGVVTVTVNNEFIPNDEATVAGTTNGAGIFNGTWKVVSATATDFTFVLPGFDTETVGSAADTGTAYAIRCTEHIDNVLVANDPITTTSGGVLKHNWDSGDIIPTTLPITHLQITGAPNFAQNLTSGTTGALALGGVPSTGSNFGHLNGTQVQLYINNTKAFNTDSTYESDAIKIDSIVAVTPASGAGFVSVYGISNNLTVTGGGESFEIYGDDTRLLLGTSGSCDQPIIANRIRLQVVGFPANTDKGAFSTVEISGQRIEMFDPASSVINPYIITNSYGLQIQGNFGSFYNVVQGIHFNTAHVGPGGPSPATVQFVSTGSVSPTITGTNTDTWTIDIKAADITLSYTSLTNNVLEIGLLSSSFVQAGDQITISGSTNTGGIFNGTWTVLNGPGHAGGGIVHVAFVHADVPSAFEPGTAKMSAIYTTKNLIEVMSSGSGSTFAADAAGRQIYLTGGTNSIATTSGPDPIANLNSLTNVKGLHLAGFAQTQTGVGWPRNYAIHVENGGLVRLDGGLSHPLAVYHSTNYTPTRDDYMLLCTAAITITLDALGKELENGQTFRIKNITQGGAVGNVTVASTDLIDGQPSITLSQYQSVDVYWDGINWWVF